MSTIATVVRAPAGAHIDTAALDPRASRAQTSVVQFTGLMAQLGVLLACFYLYRVEERTFGILALLIVGIFAIHYWLPFAWKEPFLVGSSLVGAFVMLDGVTALLLIGAGLAIFAILAAPLPIRVRLATVAVVAGALIYGRATRIPGIPSQFWPVFGALFMFRLIVYLYDFGYGKIKPELRSFLAYFFLLPNYYFLLFPVVDYQTMRATYFRRDIHATAQQGIVWISRGLVQLLLYRLVYHWKGPSNAPEVVTSFAGLVSTVVLTYLLYLRVSGQFHIAIGFLHLFGYDLPETHRRYLLARSLTDFWRRINIYWKDFMVKIVYFPVYFRMRRQGEVRAQVVATVLVFVVTWFLHAYQWFWLRGEFLMTWPDTAFWGILGILVTVNVIVESRTPGRRTASAQWSVREAMKTGATFVLIVTLWSLWNSPSISEWLDLVTWWRVG